MHTPATSSRSPPRQADQWMGIHTIPVGDCGDTAKSAAEVETSLAARLPPGASLGRDACRRVHDRDASRRHRDASRRHRDAFRQVRDRHASRRYRDASMTEMHPVESMTDMPPVATEMLLVESTAGIRTPPKSPPMPQPKGTPRPKPAQPTGPPPPWKRARLV